MGSVQIVIDFLIKLSYTLNYLFRILPFFSKYNYFYVEIPLVLATLVILLIKDYRKMLIMD